MRMSARFLKSKGSKITESLLSIFVLFLFFWSPPTLLIQRLLNRFDNIMTRCTINGPSSLTIEHSVNLASLCWSDWLGKELKMCRHKHVSSHLPLFEWNRAPYRGSSNQVQVWTCPTMWYRFRCMIWYETQTPSGMKSADDEMWRIETETLSLNDMSLWDSYWHYYAPLLQ